jgi:hypothetical protein
MVPVMQSLQADQPATLNALRSLTRRRRTTGDKSYARIDRAGGRADDGDSVILLHNPET